MEVVIRLDSHVSFKYKKLRAENKSCWRELKDYFTHDNPVYHRNERMGIPNWNEPDIYKSFATKKGRVYFSRGGINKIKKILKRWGHEIKIRDKRIKGEKVDFKSKSNIKLRKIQKEPCKVLKKKKQGILHGPCSSGKSVMGLKFIEERGRRAIVVVWNKDHQKQWISEATNKKLLNMDKRDIGGVGGVFGKRKLGALNVCMQQSLWNKNHRDFFFRDGKCGTLVADEVQRFAARTCHEVVDDSPAEGRVGVTAESKRKDGKEFLIYDVFGNLIFSIPDCDIKTRKKSRINLVPSEYENDSYDFNSNYTELLNDMARNKKRNKLIVKRTVQKTKKKKLVLILVERKFQALYLYDLLTRKEKLKVKLLVGKTTKKELSNADDWKSSWKMVMKNYNDDEEFFAIKKLGNAKKIDVIIATQKGEVGLNIKTIDHVIVSTPTGGNLERLNQQKGRCERDYDKKLKRTFGNKGTPSVDYIWDIKIDKVKRKGSNILKNFNNVHILQTRRKGNGKNKRKKAA